MYLFAMTLSRFLPTRKHFIFYYIHLNNVGVFMSSAEPTAVLLPQYFYLSNFEHVIAKIV